MSAGEFGLAKRQKHRTTGSTGIPIGLSELVELVKKREAFAVWLRGTIETGSDDYRERLDW